MNSRRLIASPEAQDTASYRLKPALGRGTLRRRCPLWVISGHMQCKKACQLYPRKRTLRHSSDNLVYGHSGRMTLSKLISWNVGSRVKDRRSAQLEWIASEQADVLALQEVVGASDLQQRLSVLGFEYFATTEPTDSRKKLVAIASREPFRDISPLAVPHPERAISRLISLRGEAVELHCVHVPPGSNYGPIKIEFLEAVISGLSTRERPQLLVGDFNCPRLMEPEVVTWAQRRGKDGWYVRKTRDGIAGSRCGSGGALNSLPSAKT